MKRVTVALACLALAGCANQPIAPLPALTQARATHRAVCGEVLRLRQAGVDLPAARNGCITADDILDAADVAYRAGQLAEATSGAQRALVYITAAQALVLAASNGAVK